MAAQQQDGFASGRRTRLRRLRRRLADWAGIGRIRGREPVRIDELISPLRFDILVRQEYFAFLDRNEELLGGELGRLVELSRSEPYFRWFVAVVVPRFKPELAGHAALIERAFEQRVAAAVELRRSFARSGPDPRRPLTLETGRVIEPTTTGKRLSRRLYPGDGCHRLALLRSRGVEVLEPGTYCVRTRARFRPLDNTSLLLRELTIDRSEYWRFMELSYGELVHVDRSVQPRDCGPADAERLTEMREVAARDEPLLAPPR